MSECKISLGCIYDKEKGFITLEEHDRQIRTETIDEYRLKLLNCKMPKGKSTHDAEIWTEFKRQAIGIAQQLKEQNNE